MKKMVIGKGWNNCGADSMGNDGFAKVSVTN